jgi:PAS domain S-box-containing protein
MSQVETAQPFDAYLTVGEAAEFLGVSPWTLRNWDKSGRLKPSRHPKNGYRIYRREALTAALEPAETLATQMQRLTPRMDWSALGESEHFVQFYEDDHFLIESVCGFIGTAIVTGETAVIIATAAHRIAIEKELSSRGLDLTNARDKGKYICADAAEMLTQFMVDGSPDADRFHDVIGGTIARAAQGGKRIRAFGEMVALLWAEGNRAAAVKLEQLWNDLAKRHSFSLFCAYPLRGFDGAADGESFGDICTCHSRVLPAESYAALPTAEDRLRAISLLQQKATSLDAALGHRKEAEAALLESQKRHHDLMDLLPAGVYTCEAPSGQIRYYNRRAGELWGREPGGPLRTFRLDDSPVSVEDDPMVRVLRGGAPVRDHEMIVERPDGSRITVMVNVDPIVSSTGEVVGAVNVFQDISARKLAEAELEKAEATAERASKAKDEFLAVLSHELRTPLTPVLMTTASMAAEAGLSQRMRDGLAMIRRNIALETRLIDDLLDLSRVVNGKMTLHKQHVHLHPLIAEVVEMVAEDARAKSLNVQLKLDAPQDRVLADSARVHQVVWNLLHNAIKFTPQQGNIVVRTRNDGDRVIIEVKDDGIGIDPKSIATIFNAFDQGNDAARTFGGLGLGLAIANAVVQMHDGSIAAHSDGIGCGACFTVTMPTAVADGDADVSTKTSAAVDARPDGRRVLLVDDHCDTLAVLRRLLEFAGHSVTPATSVAEAVRASANNHFDILISDIGLPDGTGLDVVRQVHTHQPGLPAIALTGYGMERDVRESQEAGFSAHMTKPIDMDQLKAAIRRLA